MNDYRPLETIAKKIRTQLVHLHHATYASHIGSGFSATDILTILYFKICNISKENFDKKDRDRVILSKGHAVASLFVTLKEKGILSGDELSGYYTNGQNLGGHPNYGIKGIEASTGSLGHGLPMAVGMALANKLDDNNNEVFVILGDGECNEGTVYESAMLAMRFGLDNLTIIIDCNGIQGYDFTKEICPQERLESFWASLGGHLIKVNGHDFKELDKALDKKRKIKGKPKIVIARTVKGKGVSFMENKLEWHYKSPDDSQKEKAVQEIKSGDPQ